MIRNLLRFVGWRHVWRRPVRTALTIVGVAVGVALFVAISAINQSTLDFFRTNVGSMTGKATFTILGPEGGFAEETVEVARKVPSATIATTRAGKRTSSRIRSSSSTRKTRSSSRRRLRKHMT